MKKYVIFLYKCNECKFYHIKPDNDINVVIQRIKEIIKKLDSTERNLWTKLKVRLSDIKKSIVKRTCVYFHRQNNGI